MTSPPAHRTRVVITGMGAITNLGLDASSTWDGMVAGRSGISRITGPEFDQWADRWTVLIGGQIRNWDPGKRMDHREARRLDRVAQLGVAAACEAVEQAGIDFTTYERPERAGVIIGSGVGGITTIEDGVLLLHGKGPDRISPFTVPKLMVNSCAGTVSIKFGLQGPSTAHATACASSGHSIADAMHIIQRGEADVMLAGGSEAAVSPICVAAFMTMKALSTRNDAPEKASRPFDRDRDGFVLAEGAGVFVLESEAHAKKRGATILGELVGAGASSDAAHITAPDEQGRGAARAMKWALQHAGLNLADIDYVNAHGTSTPLGDAAEVNAVLNTFGDHARVSRGGRLLMSSTKSMHGHCLGASGGIEMIACVNAIRFGVTAPTINLQNPDVAFDLDLVPLTARDRKVRYALNNTFGFGGHNVSLVVGRYEG